MDNNRFKWEVTPKALEANQVKVQNCRFTVLTPWLIRMEYDKQNVFEDRASQMAFHRDFETVGFESRQENGLLYIETAEFILTYKVGTEFSDETLNLKLKNEPATVWHFGDEIENLGGTASTLDRVDGARTLGNGVCSRFGISVIDDSNTVLLGEDGWIELRNENTKDIYLFAYGYNYRQAVSDFMRLTGAPPLLPAYALGNWWSRYYEYTQESYLELMERFKQEDVPFSVGVIDMDWHLVDIPEELIEEDEIELKKRNKYHQYGWTGYTWNEKLFPDYKAFLKELRERNLYVALNLHPAMGVRKFECMYDELARAEGIDPKSGRRVPLNLLSKKSMENYFDIIHHPYEEDGVDFWWMDWQQGFNYWWIRGTVKDTGTPDPREKVGALWLLNHLHILDIMRNGKRPMFFSRYAGPGSQRYPVGFSGDTWVTWESLKFQPYFTATASNIGYCWWSHDIGGHMGGYRDEELLCRWIQLGVFSPINRLHSSKIKFLCKEPWTLSKKNGEMVSSWLRLRHRLIPYIYTMNYRTHTECLPLVEPMYYLYPKCSAAYEVPNQFMFGTELMIAPITEPNSKIDNLGRADVWLPKGDWFDFETGLHYYSKKGRKMDVFRDIESYPIFAKAGAIVPLYSHYEHENSIKNDENVELFVFPGNSNSFTLYEDAGDYSDYKNGGYATTKFELEYGENAVFTINPAVGDISLIPQKRNFKINLRGFNENVNIKIEVDGKVVGDIEIEYANNTHTFTVPALVTSCVKVYVSGEMLVTDNSCIDKLINEIVCESELPFARKDVIYASAMDKKAWLHDRIFGMRCQSYEDKHIINAIKELLTLTEEEQF